MTNSQTTRRIVVAGAGLSGLSAARAMREEAARRALPVEITVLEKEPVAGGKIRSLREEGFLYETGPNGFLDNKPSTLALARRMGMEGRLLKSQDKARKRFVFSGGRLQQLPEDPFAFAASELLSIRGKLRLATEFFLPQGDAAKDETVAEFVRRRLGQEALDKLIDPMASGVYAGDPGVMSMKSCFPKVVAIEQQFGGLLKGMMAMQKMAKARGQQAGMNAGPGGNLWSFINGAEELPARLAEELGDNLRKGVSAVEAAKQGREWMVKTSDGQTLAADALVVATPAYDAAAMLAAAAPEASRLLGNIPYVTTASVSLGFDSVSHPLDGFGYLIPFTEGRKILGGLWSSSIFTHRAPDGKVLIHVLVGGARRPELVRLDDEALTVMVLDELQFTLGIAQTPVFRRIVRWDRAIPQYVVGHDARVKDIEARLAALGGIFLGGNAYYGIGYNDCTARAEALGACVLDALASQGQRA